MAGDPPCSFDYKSFIVFILWLIHFFNYACPRAILNEFIFPIIEGESLRAHGPSEGGQVEFFNSAEKSW